MSTPLRSFAPEPEPEPEPQPQRRSWTRIAAWIGGIFIVLTLVLVGAAAIVLKSTWFHNYLLAKVQSTASAQLGVPVKLQNYALHFSTLGLEIYGLTVAGASPYANPPLLQLQHAEVGVRIVSILHKKWYLSDVRLDHPVVQVFVDKQGDSNLPKLKSSNSQSHTSIFDLGIRHAILDQGEIYYNNRSMPLVADVHDLDFHSSFNDLQKDYSGTLAYDKGRVAFGAYQPFEHAFEAQFDATPTAFQLHRARLSSGATNVNLVATATNFNSPTVQAQYEVVVDGGQMAKLLNNPSIPTGMVKATGSAHYQQSPNQSLLETLSVNGDLTSPKLAAKAGSINATIDNLAAHYSLVHGDATLHDFRANFLGGQITANGAMRQLGGSSPHSEMNAELHNISLAAATQLAGRSAARSNVALTGVLNAKATASWGKTLNDLVAHADATIRGNARQKPAHITLVSSGTAQPAPISGPIPIDSVLHAVYTGARHQVAVNQSYIKTPQTTLTMNGTVSEHSSLGIQLQADDLREIATLADLFRSPNPSQPQQPLDLAGTATFRGSIQGSTSAPHITGQLTASNLHVNGSDWKVVRTGIDARPSQVSLQNADLEPQSKGRITLNASAGLNKWAFAKTSPLQINLNASQLNIAELAKLTGKQVPVEGTLNTHLALHGSEMNPIGNGTLSLTKVTAYDEPISSVQVTFNGAGDEAHADLAVQMPAGSVQGRVSVRPKEKTYTAQLTSDGIQLDQLQALKARKVGVSGVVSLHANGQGTFDNPQLTASVQIPSLTIQKQVISNFALNLNLANHVANATLDSKAVNTSMQAKARVELTGDYPTDASIDTQGIPLQPLVAAYSPAQAASIQGQTELHATLHGPLKNKNRLEAHITIPYLKLAYNNTIQLASNAPIRADYKNGVLVVQRSAIRGTDTDLEFQASIPTNNGAPMSLLLEGKVDLQLAQLFNPDIRTSGQLRFNINSQGATGRDIGGEIDILDANYASGELPVGLQHGNGVLKLTTDRINISSFQGTVGGGTVTAQGGVAYRPHLQFDLGLSAHNIRMLYPQGMRENINANIRLAGTTDNATLGGTVNLADLSFTPAFDLTSFIGQFSGGVVAPPSQGFSQNINLNLAVHSTNNVNLVSRTMSVNGAANLQIRGTAADPVILGRVNLNSGDVILNGNRFVLSAGTIQFVNPAQTEPVVNLTIATTIQQYTIDLRFNGPIDHLQTQYISDPALPQADVINLLAFGQTTEASQVASANTTTTQTGESLIASQVSSQITSRISKVAGISQLSISPVLGNNSNTGNGGANITIQQRVTGNLFVTFSENTANSTQVIQGQYRISPRVSLSATRDPNGGFGVDTLIKKTW